VWTKNRRLVLYVYGRTLFQLGPIGPMVQTRKKFNLAIMSWDQLHRVPGKNIEILAVKKCSLERSFVVDRLAKKRPKNSEKKAYRRATNLDL